MNPPSTKGLSDINIIYANAANKILEYYDLYNFNKFEAATMKIF
jgi:hypothetical protein